MALWFPLPEPRLLNHDADSIAARLTLVRNRIERAENQYHRAAHSVTLLAVSKSLPAEYVRAVYDAGQHCFGESYVQEALDKIAALDRLAIEWHFVGRVQSNKTRAIADAFSWVHGVDRFRIAQRLSEQRPAHLPPLNICLQVNLSREASKAGIDVDRLTELAHAVLALPRLRLRGLMAIPEQTRDFKEQRKLFRELRLARDKLGDEGLVLDTLSMGMSDDLEAAIAEGATIVRVGTAIFGTRAR